MGSGDGRSKRERIYGNTQLIHFALWQKLTRHCKAIILQLQEKRRRRTTSEKSGRTQVTGEGICSKWR